MTCPACGGDAYTDLGLHVGEITASRGETPQAIDDGGVLVRCDGCGVLYDTGVAGE